MPDRAAVPSSGGDELAEILAIAEEMQHELEIFMSGVAKWFSTHPQLSNGALPPVHSVKSRLKNLEHLRDKLGRKADQNDPITKENLCKRVCDLAGVRVLHLHQQQFSLIHECIMNKVNVKGDWVLDESAKAYTWDPESEAFFKAFGLECHLKPSFYTSVHYVVRPKLNSPLACEIQVRTLFEEIWGEIDHAVNYPEVASAQAVREQLKVLAKVVGAGSRLADSIFRCLDNGRN